MESPGKFILAAVFIVFFFVLAPMIFSSALSSFGGGALFGSVNKTLSQPTIGQKGIIAVSYNSGEDFENAEVHTGNLPQILVLNTYQKFYIAGTNSGLIVSRDGGLNWYPLTDLEKQIDSNTSIYDFARGPGGALYIAAYKNGHGVLYVTNDSFFTATSIWEEANMHLRALSADSGYLYMGLDDGRLLRYSYSRQTFEKMTTFSSGVQNLTFAGNENLFVNLKSGNIYIDNGTRSKFSKIQTPGSSGFFFSQSNFRLTNDSANSNSLFLASTGKLFHSNDGGSFWTEINSILSTQAQIAAIAVQGGEIYLTSEAKFYKSDDGGISWKVSEPMPTNQKFGTLYVENGGKTVIVGTKS